VGPNFFLIHFAEIRLTSTLQYQKMEMKSVILILIFVLFPVIFFPQTRKKTRISLKEKKKDDLNHAYGAFPSNARSSGFS